MSLNKNIKSNRKVENIDNNQSKGIAEIKRILGKHHYSEDKDAMQTYLTDWRGHYIGQAQLVVFPNNVEKISKIVKICAREKISIVPQGGNTSMCGGSVPLKHGTSILLSTSRLNKILSLDSTNYTMTVEAGCILQHIQKAALEADRYFPLSLAAEGSCMIGGNLATNAGGTNVLRYGNARDLVLGLEIVLPDGRIINELQGLRKDNTGYDLKQLFLGSEGTLGIITKAVLKLHPVPKTIKAAYCAVPNIPAALELLNRARMESGDCVETFELISRLVMELVIKHIPGARDPLDTPYEHYVLLEIISTKSNDEGLTYKFEHMLEKAMEDGLILDAALAQTEKQRQAFWALRENATESQKLEGASIKHDISIPLSSIPAFYTSAWQAILAVEPRARLLAFGHAGDGNIHFNVAEPEGGKTSDFMNKWDAINCAVHDSVKKFNGSISAEHGIGQLKRNELPRYKSDTSLDVMKMIKNTLDPHGIMNPGKVI
ncbi:MAG: hydroxyacid dehydrogenase [Rhodospirillaceae bacterium]|nr:hydroxyacid dehydrogenase [Rhodospirillaceae bacterium]|tara:strand:- start:2272 stop:3738 length:1467 start_codon:yes stop_codon:yes gene_type:complete